MWVYMGFTAMTAIPLIPMGHLLFFGLIIGCYILMGIFCKCLLISATLQKMALKPDRHVFEIVNKLNSAIFTAITSVPVLVLAGYICETSGSFCPDF